MSTAIVWFRRNLRLTDNAALRAASQSGSALIALYIDDGDELGGASRWWLHHSLTALRQDLDKLGCPLTLAQGKPEQVIADIVNRCGAEALYFNRRNEPDCRSTEQRLREKFADSLDIVATDDSLLRRPAEVATQSGAAYKVFTPYWKSSVSLGDPPPPLPAPEKLKAAKIQPDSVSIESLRLLPRKPDWSKGLQSTWQPGERGALDRLDTALELAGRYKSDRDRPDIEGTTRLSPHLYFGEISPRQVWHAIRSHYADKADQTGADALIRQLYWRDFSAYLLFHFPDLPTSPLRSEYAAFPWQDDDEALKAWQRGQTGIPLVDAGMRQLWETGWMHNRVRMVVASFLVKNLLQHWRHGAEWFLDTLVDADLANNSASWQWVAGCGTDASPYFRVFNPVLQSKKFDPHGRYLRRWLPELTELSDDVIHEPWLADGMTLQLAKVRLGVDYPHPIVDLKTSRQRALDRYSEFRELISSGITTAQ